MLRNMQQRKAANCFLTLRQLTDYQNRCRLNKRMCSGDAESTGITGRMFFHCKILKDPKVDCGVFTEGFERKR